MLIAEGKAEPRRGGDLAVWLALLVSGCAQSGSASLEIRFAAGVDEEAVQSIELSLLDSCDGVENGARIDGERRWTFLKNGTHEDLRNLPLGKHAFYGRALADGCGVLAAGCEPFEIKIKKNAPVILTLLPVAAQAGCVEGQTCVGSECIDPDSGAPDGSADALPDAPVDSGVEDDQCPGDVCVQEDCTSAVPIAKVYGGLTNTCAIDSMGRLWCWGSNDQKQLGIGSQIAEDPGVPEDCADDDCQQRPQLVVHPVVGRTWVSVTISDDHTCAIDNSKHLYCWGDDSFGQVGDGKTSGNVDVPVAVNGGIDIWRKVDAAGGRTCALRDDGNKTMWCWGNNTAGRLGIGATTPVRNGTPDRIDNGDTIANDWTDIALGSQHSCAVRVGAIYCWGSNTNSQLAQSSATTSVTQPTSVPLPMTVERIDVGFNHACASTGTGTIYCWGHNTYGQLASGSGAAEVVTPISVPWAGNYGDSYSMSHANHGCGIAGGALYCWGDNDDGQLAQSPDVLDETGTAVKVDVPRSWMGVATGRRHTCAVTDGGLLFCWGDNSVGQLGRPAAPPFDGSGASVAFEPHRVCFTEP